MPSLRKLEIEEVKVIESKGISQRKLVEQEYDAMITQFNTGDYAELTLDTGETKPMVRHRMNAAALRAGVELKWMRGTGESLKFKVVSSPFESADTDENGTEEDNEFESFELAPDPEPEPQPEPVPAAKPKRRSNKPVTDRQAFVEAP